GLRGHVGAASTQDPVLQQTVDQGPRIGDCVSYAGKFGDPHQRTGQGSRSRIAHKPTLRGGNTRKLRTGTLDRSSCSADRSPTVRRVPAGPRRLADTPRFTHAGDTCSIGWEPANVRRITVADSTPQGQETLSNLLHESRSFPPPADLAAEANVKADAYEKADEDRLE